MVFLDKREQNVKRKEAGRKKEGRLLGVEKKRKENKEKQRRRIAWT